MYIASALSIIYVIKIKILFIFTFNQHLDIIFKYKTFFINLRNLNVITYNSNTM